MAGPTNVERWEDFGRQTLFWSLTVSATTGLLFLIFGVDLNSHSFGALSRLLMLLLTALIDAIAGAAGFIIWLVLLLRFKTLSYPGVIAVFIALAFWFLLGRIGD